MKLLEIYARLKKDVHFIEKRLEQAVRSDHALLNEASLHLLKAGGKRIRPVLVLLAGELGSYDLERLHKVAVALELIHMASLVHDDVIDDAATRRGKQTVKAKWDNRTAMYAGDYIFAKALATIGELDHARLHQSMSKAIVEMSIGEIEQIRYFFNTNQSVRTYLLRIRRKTALLIAISCQLGAIAAGASESKIRAMYAFGYNVGMAFQIRDDILDLCGTEKELGKPPGSDIRQGNLTLPVLYALQEDDQAQVHKEIVQIKHAGSAAQTERFLYLIRNGDGISKAETLSNRYIDKAISALDACEPGKTKNNFIEIAHFIGKRSY